MFYNTYAESITTYAILIYGAAAKSNLSRIKSVQRRILRAVFVGAFLVKSARHLQWLVFFLFFVRLQSHSDWATFLTIETT